MHERREDPRTDPSRSLQNLLRMRARREAFDLAVVSTGDGVLMASSRQGSIAERSRASFKAGCDVVLHCNGKLDEMAQVAAESPELAGEALARADRALASRRTPQPFDRGAARAELDRLIDRAGSLTS